MLPGPQPSGLFLFDKPKGITSHDAVDLLRRKLSIRRIGHTGTLDPMATGLLILLVGGATSAQAALQGSAKVYGGTIMFGTETDTWDAEGKVVAEAPPPPFDEETIKKAVEKFSGRFIQQVPPYSAVRRNGEPLYKLARRNEAVPEVRREAVVRWLSWSVRPPALDFELECSGVSRHQPAISLQISFSVSGKVRCLTDMLRRRSPSHSLISLNAGIAEFISRAKKARRFLFATCAAVASGSPGQAVRTWMTLRP